MIRLWNWMVLKYWERKLNRVDWAYERGEVGKCSECGEFRGNDKGEWLVKCKCERMCEKYARKLGREYFAEEIDG